MVPQFNTKDYRDVAAAFGANPLLCTFEIFCFGCCARTFAASTRFLSCTAFLASLMAATCLVRSAARNAGFCSRFAVIAALHQTTTTLWFRQQPARHEQPCAFCSLQRPRLGPALSTAHLLVQSAEHDCPVELGWLETLQRVRLTLGIHESEHTRVSAHKQTAVARIDFEPTEIARFDLHVKCERNAAPNMG